ncbi:MAG: hypothetical protein LBQ76_07830 [Candidatus Fibromonas sp.]|jgi:hypothetical protein|nr:hypothetical protein [Candidatus Fibromonas sp.]
MNKLFLIVCLLPFCAIPGHAQCGPDEFSGVGTGANEEEALNTAYSLLARQIHSSVKVSEKYTQSQKVSGGKENLNSGYASKTEVESSLINAHDARVLRIERSKGKTSVTVCMSRSAAAKGFAEKQRLVADSLEIAANFALGAEHPKSKNEAWQRTQALWNEFARLQGMIEGLGAAKADFYDAANKVYSQAKDEQIAYCQNSKQHWTPEKENNYSELALSMLSKNLKMEKSACKGKGVSLIYKNTEPECSQKFGLHSCSYKPSLSVASCEGVEYRLLEGSAEGAHQKQDFALEKLQNNLKTAQFWQKWEQEIKEWSPQCK